MSCSARTLAERALATALLPGVRRRLAAAGALWLAACCACSGSTDVVGVLDPSLTDVPVELDDELEDEVADNAGEVDSDPLSGVPGQRAEPDAEQALLVAGLARPEWQGPTSPWPLDTRLSSFFAEPDWASSSGPGPARVQRQAFELRGGFFGAEREQVRFAAPTGAAAQSLRSWFADVLSGLRDADRSLVARDSWGDQYLVALEDEDERCGRSGRRGPDCSELDGFESARE